MHWNFMGFRGLEVVVIILSVMITGSFTFIEYNI